MVDSRELKGILIGLGIIILLTAVFAITKVQTTALDLLQNVLMMMST